ncbi:MAG: VacJ family lipoprotein [Deltaproteobacteria bacterium]|nr:VacJ family lipoprotein [Deltaproteobacteria bacterium]
MIDGKGNTPEIRWRPILARALLLAAICAYPSWVAAEEPTAATEAVSGSGQETGKSLEEPGAQGAAPDDAWDSALDDPEPFPEKPPVRVADPLEPVNRAFFVFNDRLYFWLLKPVARGYAFLVPEFARIGIRNAFENVKMPVRLVNSLLQGKVKGSGRELARFTINSTIGLAGLFDTAKHDWGIAASEEDTGQTLAAAGLGHGAYLVIPFLGPSSLRDGVGLGGDIFLNPLWFLFDDPWTSVGIYAGKSVNNTSLVIGEYEDIKAAAIDPYLAVRDGYIQYREGQVAR